MNNKIEIYWKLHESAWSSFQRRADHEFKFAVTVWTAYAAFIAIILKSGINFENNLYINLILLGFLVLHIYYEYGMTVSNDADLAKCYDLEKKIKTEFNYNYSHKTNKKIFRIKNSCFLSRHWSHFAHIAITLLLAISSLVLIKNNQIHTLQNKTVIISTTEAPIINVSSDANNNIK